MEMFSFTMEERHGNTICEIECSDLYNTMLENGECDYLLKKFNEAISILSRRIRNGECEKEFTEPEIDILSLVLSLIEEE